MCFVSLGLRCLDDEPSAVLLKNRAMCSLYNFLSSFPYNLYHSLLLSNCGYNLFTKKKLIVSTKKSHCPSLTRNHRIVRFQSLARESVSPLPL
jgi:hypothetical protein